MQNGLHEAGPVVSTERALNCFLKVKAEIFLHPVTEEEGRESQSTRTWHNERPEDGKNHMQKSKSGLQEPNETPR